MVRINQATDMLWNVDIQETFMPGESRFRLPVTGGRDIVPAARANMLFFERENRGATVDVHPWGHISLASSLVGVPPNTFVTHSEVLGWTDERIAAHALFSLRELQEYMYQVKTQVFWADHGLFGSREAELHPEFHRDEFYMVLAKGMDRMRDSYSAFRDNLGGSTGLAHVLWRRGKRRLFFQGLAFDYCVGWSALDAADEGFESYVIEDATRSVGYPADSVERTKTAFAARGVRIIQSSDLASS